MKRLLLTGLGLLLMASAFAAETQPLVPLVARHDRPDPAGTPTPISLSVYLLDILSVDDVEGTITLDYYLIQTWKDPRLADEHFANPEIKRDLTLDDIWSPSISRINLQESRRQDSLLNIDAEGFVAFRQRQIDTFTTRLDLKRFPFDRQQLRLQFLSTMYGPEFIDLDWAKERSGHLDRFSLHGWKFEDFNVSEITQSVKTVGNRIRDYSGIELEVELSRSSAFYIWKVFFPLGLIVFMSWTVFWIDPANFGPQVTISTASVITLIAFQLSLVELLPRISYLTEIDIYAQGTSFLVFLALGESILTARLARIEKHKLSLSIDRWMRTCYPLGYLLLLLIVVI